MLKDICQEIFPEAEIRIGSQPNLTVAKGLALVGRTDFKIKAFRREVDSFITSEKLLCTLKNELAKLADVISNQLFEQYLSISNKILDNIRAKILFERVKGDLNIIIDEVNEQIKSEISDLANNWFQRIDLFDWTMKLSDRFNSITYYICKKYRIPRTTFNLFRQQTKYDTLSLEFLKDEFKTLEDELKTSTSSALTFNIANIILSLFPPYKLLIAPLLYLYWSRKPSLSIYQRVKLLEGDINQSIEQNRAEITKQIAEELKKQLNLTNLLDKFSNTIKEALNKKADEVAVMIK